MKTAQSSDTDSVELNAQRTIVMAVQDDKICPPVTFFLSRLDTCLGGYIRCALEIFDTARVVVSRVVQSWPDHEVVAKWVFAHPSIRIMQFEDFSSKNSGKLMIQWSHKSMYNNKQLTLLSRMINESGQCSLLYDGLFGSFYQQLSQQVRSLPYLLKHRTSIKQIAYYDGWRRNDVFRAFFNRTRLLIGPNVDLIFDPVAEASFFFAQSCSQKRPHEVGFFGSVLGGVLREQIVKLIQERHPAKVISQPITRDTELFSNMSDSQFILGGHLDYRIHPRDYGPWLRTCDFQLCLPGGFSWTHRTMEALVSQSIPIVGRSEAPYYEGLLIDGKTALIVDEEKKPGAWLEAYNKATAMTQDERVQMRKHISRLNLTKKSVYDKMLDRVSIRY